MFVYLLLILHLTITVHANTLNIKRDDSISSESNFEEESYENIYKTHKKISEENQERTEYPVYSNVTQYVHVTFVPTNVTRTQGFITENQHTLYNNTAITHSKEYNNTVLYHYSNASVTTSSTHRLTYGFLHSTLYPKYKNESTNPNPSQTLKQVEEEVKNRTEKPEKMNFTEVILKVKDSNSTCSLEDGNCEEVWNNYVNLNDSREQKSSSNASLSDYPFAASILKKGSHYATGALLDKQWVLTSAREFYNVRESIKLFRVRIGYTSSKKGGHRKALKEIVIHPYYVSGHPSWDVALLKLARPVKFSANVAAVNICEKPGKILNGKIMTMYWARENKKNGELYPDPAEKWTKHTTLKISPQKLIPWDKCYKILQNWTIYIGESSLCVKPVSVHHIHCQPVAGGLVLSSEGLWGMTSSWTSEDCLQQSSPVVITLLSDISVSHWIDKVLTVKKKHKKNKKNSQVLDELQN